MIDEVYLNAKSGRKLVTIEVVKENILTVLVRLPDGNVIKRKKKRDLQ